MKDESTATADAPENVTPTVTEGGDPPASPPEGGQAPGAAQTEERPTPGTQAEALRAARQRGRERQRSHEARSKAAKQTRDTDGTFRREDDAGGEAAEETEDPAEPGGEEDPKDPADTGGEKETDAAAEEDRSPDEGADAEGADEGRSDLVRVKLPEGHQLLESGQGEIAVASDKDAELVKALLNGTYTRRQDVEERERTIADLEAKLRNFERQSLEQKVSREVTERWKGTDAYKEAAETYRDILDTRGEDAAKRFWEGEQLRLRQNIQHELAQEERKLQEQRYAENGERWRRDTYRRLSESLPNEVVSLPSFTTLYNRSVALFNTALEQGHYPEVDSPEALDREFKRHFLNQLSQEPGVREAFEKARARQGENGQKPTPAAPQKTEEQLRAEIEEKVKREYAEKRRETPTNPIASAGHGSGPNRVTTGGADDDETDLNSLSPQQLQRHARKRARSMGREIRR